MYCSCRCGPADGAPDLGGEYCACPEGFECAQIRPYLGLGDEELAGKYCVKQGTVYDPDEANCGKVKGYVDVAECQGISAP